MRDKEKKRPEWTPKGQHDGFTTSVMGGIHSSHDGFHNDHAEKKAVHKRKKLKLQDYIKGSLKVIEPLWPGQSLWLKVIPQNIGRWPMS